MEQVGKRERGVSLFDPIALRGVTIANRIVKSAMAEGAADADGRPSDRLCRMYGRWARGGVGLAITGMAHIRPGFSYTGREIGLYDDSLVAPLRRLTAASHDDGGRIFAQLCHAPPQLPRAKAKRLGAVAPSGGFCRTNLLWNRALDDDELSALTRDFGLAAGRAREAGFDGVQLHAAHGYLLSRTLSPRDNRRRDRWGGSFDGRLTFLRETVLAVRAAVGDDFPVLVKLNAHDGVRGGLDEETSLRVGKRLETWGVDAIEVSAGIGDVGLGCYPNKGGIPRQSGKRWLGQEFPFIRPLLPAVGPILDAVGRSVALREEAYFYSHARRFADALDIPIISVGGIRSLDVAQRIVAQSRVAMVSLARPLVRQPSLPRLWQQGRSRTAQCASCNECFVHLGLDEVLRCWNADAR